MFTKRLLAVSLCLLATLVMSPTSPAAAENGSATVFAGTGEPGSSGDGGPAAQATLGDPTGVATAPDGTVYISDAANHVVRAVSPEGMITTVAGNGENGAAGTPVADGTPATEVALSQPVNIAVASDGNVYIADTGLRQVLGLSPQGALWLVAGTGETGHSGDGGPASQAGIGTPSGVAVAADGTVYMGDITNHYVRAIAPDGVISTVAGTGAEQVTEIGGDASRVPVPFPTSLAVDDDGAVWIAAAGGLMMRLDSERLSTVWSVPDEWSLRDDDAEEGARLNNIGAVATGSDGVPYALNSQDGTVLRLNGEGSLQAVGTLAPSLFGPIAVTTETIYVADITGHQVYALANAPDKGAGEDGSAAELLPYLIGGAVLVLLIVGWLVLRRRRA